MGHGYLTTLPGVDLYEFTMTGPYRGRRFLLNHDEAAAPAGLLDRLDPGLEVPEAAEVWGLVDPVTGAPPAAGRPPPP